MTAAKIKYFLCVYNMLAYIVWYGHTSLKWDHKFARVTLIYIHSHNILEINTYRKATHAQDLSMRII